MTLANTIRQWQGIITRFCKAHIIAVSAVFIGMVSLLIYSNQQAFINLWLTRDQQAMVSLQQGNAGKAALTFTDKNWIAYSYYADADFAAAANVFAQLEGPQAKFSQANALAHAGQFIQASALYKQVLAIKPQHQAATDNLKLMTEVIKKMKKSPGKKELSNEIARNQKFTNKKNKPTARKEELSSALWLQQVQQNPSKFLRKKFQQEYRHEQK